MNQNYKINQYLSWRINKLQKISQKKKKILINSKTKTRRIKRNNKLKLKR